MLPLFSIMTLRIIPMAMGIITTGNIQNFKVSKYIYLRKEKLFNGHIGAILNYISICKLDYLFNTCRKKYLVW